MRIHAKRQDSVRDQHKRNCRQRGVCLPQGNNAEAQRTSGTRGTRQEEHSRICSRYGQQTALAPMDAKPDRHQSQKTTERMDSFQTYTCLRRIMGIKWPQKVTNKNVEVSTGTNRMRDEIRTRSENRRTMTAWW